MVFQIRFRKLKTVFRFTAIVIAFFISASISAQPMRIHLSFGETSDNRNAVVNVVWSDQKTATNSMVKFGLSSENLNNKKIAIQTEYGSELVLKAFLESLKPSSVYYYRCGSEITGWSDVMSFKTAPETGEKKPFKVGIFGDTQNNEFNEDFGKTKEIVRLLTAEKPDFTLHMGDIVNNGSVESGWIGLLNAIQPLASFSPMMATLGNHDIGNSPGENFQKPYPIFFKLFAEPVTNLDYSFNYGNVHFVSVFSGYAQKAAEIEMLRYQKGSSEMDWLENDLAKASKTPGIDWIIVITHYPLHSFGWSNVKEWKARITPILDKYNVDLSLSGHRHVYERHHPLRNGKPVGEGEGTVYITNGTAGGSPQGIGGFEMPSMVFTPREKMYNYAIMNISGNTLKYEVFNLEQVKIDEFEIIKKN